MGGELMKSPFFLLLYLRVVHLNNLCIKIKLKKKRKKKAYLVCWHNKISPPNSGSCVIHNIIVQGTG